MPKKSKKPTKRGSSKRPTSTELRRLLTERTVKAVPKIRRVRQREATKLTGAKKSQAGKVRKFFKTKAKPNRSDTAHVTLLANTDPNQIKAVLKKLGKGKRGDIAASLAASYQARDGKTNITGTGKFFAGDDKAVDRTLKKLYGKLLGPGASKGGVKKGAESVRAVMIQLTFTRKQWDKRSKAVRSVTDARKPKPKPKPKPKKKTTRRKGKR